MNPRFNIFSGLLKAYEGPDGARRFSTTASSTITDLAGDEIMAPAIEQMATKAQGNLTIFLNHEYRVPEDVLGSVEQARMATRGVDAGGNPIVDLDFDIRLNDSNPRALQTYEAIKSGVKLGTSIGAIVRHAEKKKGGGLKIDDIELLEASIVGIPANPRSWVSNAVKSLAKGGFEDFEIVDETGEPDETADIEPEKTDAACPTCGKGKSASGCDDAYHTKDAEPETVAAADAPADSDPEPDKAAARTRVTVTVDSEPTADAPKSEPAAVTDEDRADVPTDDATAALGDITRDAEPDTAMSIEPEELASVVKSFRELTSKYVELQKKYDEEHQTRVDLEENFAAALKVFDRIADLPLGRKIAPFGKAVEEIRARFPQYDDEFLKFLEK